MRPWLWAAIPGPAWLPRELPAPPWSRSTAGRGTFPGQDLSPSFSLQGSAAGFLGERVSPAGITQSLELVDPPAFKPKRKNPRGDS